MATAKYKDYLINAFSDSVAKSHDFLTFCYDPEFFADITENLTDSDNFKSLSFPVDQDYFELHRYVKQGSYKNRFDLNLLTENKFCKIEKFRKFIDPEDVIDTARLHICKDTFHFEVKTVSGLSFSTLDFDNKFVDDIEKTYYQKVLNKA